MTTKTDLIQITSIVPETPSANKRLIVARWKDTEKRSIAPANRVRCVELDANIWSGIIASDNKSFVLFVDDAVEELAKSFLSTIVEESSWLRTEVPQQSFQLENLLAWQQQRAELSARLNADAIKQWATNSKTVANVRAQHGAQTADALINQFAKLAGPNHGISAEKAGKILAKLFNQDDVNDNTGLRVMLKLETIRDKPKASESALDDIL